MAPGSGLPELPVAKYGTAAMPSHSLCNVELNETPFTGTKPSIYIQVNVLTVTIVPYLWRLS